MKERLTGCPVKNVVFTRRRVLHMLSALGGISATGLGIAAGKTMLDSHALDQECSEIFSRSMMGGIADFHFIPSVNNPYASVKGVSKPSEFAIKAIGRHLGITAEDRKLIDQMPIRIDGHAVFVGGPLANLYSRQILGYGGYQSPLLKQVGSDVPCTFINLFSDDHTAKPEFILSVDGKRFVGNANEDYLLLTCIPNIFSKDFGISDHRILIVSGVHGAGTMAIKDLLTDIKILSSIRNSILNVGPAWQIVIKVEFDERGDKLLSLLAPAMKINADFKELNRVCDGHPFCIDTQDPQLRLYI